MTDIRVPAVIDAPGFGEFVRMVAEGLGYEVRVSIKDRW